MTDDAQIKQVLRLTKSSS